MTFPFAPDSLPTRVTFRSPFAVAVMGNPRTSDFELVELTPEAVPEEQLRRFAKRGMSFLGFAGVLGGIPQISLDEPLEEDSAKALAQAYLLHLEWALDAQLMARCVPIAG